MRHPRYCLTHHPGIFSNITNATHFSTPAMPTTLAHRPLYSHWCTLHQPCDPHWHVTLARHSHNPRQHVTHTGMSPTLACHQRKHTTHVSKPPTQARQPRYIQPFLKQRVISQTPVYPIKFLKLLDLKFQEALQIAVFTFNSYFYSLYFLGLLKHIHKVWKTAIEKRNVFRGNQSALFKRRLFCQKQLRNFFRKNCFPILVSLWPFYYTMVY